MDFCENRAVSVHIGSIKLFITLLVFTGFSYTPIQRINVDVLERKLKDHPDRESVKFVVDGFRHGFRLGVSRRPKPRPPCRNGKLVRENPEIAQKLVDKEVAKGHILGPFDFDNPPLPELFFSPINLVRKINSPDEFRLIHDLSHPFGSDESVNACIPEEESSVQYHYLDEVIEMAIRIGVSAVASRLDVQHAFRNLGACAEDLWLLAFSLNGKIYLDSSVAFGSASSCRTFERVATMLEWIVRHETSAEWLSHFLDDYILLEKNTELLLQLMDHFRAIFKEIGMPLAEEKTLGPTNIIEYLGLVLNLLRQLILIPETKRNKCFAKIETFLSTVQDGKRVTIKMIQKLAGSLNFICQALPAGKPFLQGLYKLTRAAKPGQVVKQHHHRRVPKEVVEDLLMFKSFLQECAAERVKSVPFLSRLGIFNTQLELYADAAGNFAAGGAACMYKNQWAAGFWRETTIYDYGFQPNIALLEMLAIVMAVEIWAPLLAGKTIILRSDNEATCKMIRNQKADIPACLSLLRHLTKISLHFQLLITTKHISSEDNWKTDLISRGKFGEFRFRNKSADIVPQPLPSSLWPPTWTPKEMLKPHQFLEWEARQAVNRNRLTLVASRHHRREHRYHPLDHAPVRPQSARQRRRREWFTRNQHRLHNTQRN